MTGLPSWAEFTALLALIGTGIGGLLSRERRITTLKADVAKAIADTEKVKEEAVKALRAHEEAMDMKNEEIRLFRENGQRREDRLEHQLDQRNERIQHLEDMLYTGKQK